MHFLGSDVGGLVIGKLRAAVRVRVAGGKRDRHLLVEPDEERPIFVLKADALVVELPERFKVVGPDGKRIRPSGKFLVTTEIGRAHV